MPGSNLTTAIERRTALPVARGPRAPRPPLAALSTLVTLIALTTLTLMGTGCSAPLKLDYSPPSPTGQSTRAARIRAESTPTVFVKPFKDRRPRGQRGERDIGTISVTVSDITGTRLSVADDVGAYVTAAFGTELERAGYTVVAEGSGPDLIVSGEVLSFRLDIGTRDAIDLALLISVEEAGTGRVVWSGPVEFRAERYAGVMGNSRATINEYLSVTLSKVIEDALAEISARVDRVGERFAPPPLPPPGTGRLIVTTTPARAGVYIEDVYYGLTPITIDMAPGVYELIIRRDGFKDASERVSVRETRITEFETGLKAEE